MVLQMQNESIVYPWFPTRTYENGSEYKITENIIVHQSKASLIRLSLIIAENKEPASQHDWCKIQY